MGKKSKTTVTPPDPVATANAQTQSNIATAANNQRLNMVSTQDPYGSSHYEEDPTAPGGFKQVTTLSDAQQALLNGQQQTALDQMGRVNTALATPLSTDGLPGLSSGADLHWRPITSSFDKGQAVQYDFKTGQPVKYDFADAGAIQNHVGGNLDAVRQQAQDAAYAQATSRLDPRFQTQEDHLRAQLANQGLGYNSDAYGSAVGQFGRDRNDAYSQAQQVAVGQGNTAANDQFTRELNQGQFTNAAQQQNFGQLAERTNMFNAAAGQDFGQNATLGAFHNAAAGQDFSQNEQAAEFANAAAAQDFQQSLQQAQLNNTSRQQGLDERAYVQNQPINQLAALTSGVQVQGPQAIQYTTAQQSPTDVLGAYALNAQVQNQNAQRAAAANNGSGFMNGLFSLGSAALMGSDRRLKTDIVRIGDHDVGVPLYTYRYHVDPPGTRRVGVMADEVRTVRPDLVVNIHGMDSVNYVALGL